jgi:hypothetical protein
MTDTILSQLTSASAVALTDKLVIVKNPLTLPDDQIITVSDFLVAIGSSIGSSNGWMPVTDTWSYSSASNIIVPTDATTVYQVGDKIKFTQHGVTKQFYAITSASALLTVYAGYTYLVENTSTYPITNIYYSHSLTPVGFPAGFNYTPTGPTNTTLTGRFSVNGNLCSAVIMGAVTGSGVDFTNQPTLPIKISANQKTVAAPGLYFDSGTALRLGKIMGYVAANGTTIPLKNAELTGDMTSVTSTTPITWTTSDYWTVQCVYEI